jgi:hypothetical protein
VEVDDATRLRRLIEKRVSRPLEAFGAFGIAVGAVAFQAATSQFV